MDDSTFREPTLQDLADEGAAGPDLTTREKIEHWMRVFECQWNDVPVTLTVSQRELLGKLLLEECIEAITLGLGLQIGVNNDLCYDVQFISTTTSGVAEFTVPTDDSGAPIRDYSDLFSLRLNEGQTYDPIEFADGLADTAWVAYYNARVAGFNLDAVIDEVYESNMSKLDADGQPIHNECQIEPDSCADSYSGNQCDHLIDPTKPRGKILKGPNFRTPDIAKAIFF